MRDSIRRRGPRSGRWNHGKARFDIAAMVGKPRRTAVAIDHFDSHARDFRGQVVAFLS